MKKTCNFVLICLKSSKAVFKLKISFSYNNSMLPTVKKLLIILIMIIIIKIIINNNNNKYRTMDLIYSGYHERSMQTLKYVLITYHGLPSTDGRTDGRTI